MAVEMISHKVAVGAPKINNFVKSDRQVLQHLKYLLGFQLLVGANRLYLLYDDKLKSLLGYLYTLVATTCVVFMLLNSGLTRVTYIVFKNTLIVEMALLSFNSMFLYRKTLRRFFEKIDTFDSLLNINNEPLVFGFSFWYLFIFVCIFLIIITLEVLYLTTVEKFVAANFINYSYLLMYFALLTHDTEIIFFCALLVMVMKRVKVLKGHVAKLAARRGRAERLEGLSRNANLDVTRLHDAYDLLHACSEKLNSAMSFPMVVLFTASGLSSIMLLKDIFTTVQGDEEDKFTVKALVLYAIVYCTKFTVLVVMPCHFSNITTTQVSSIRTMLHDIINTKTMEKYERRKLKAFFQLTRDSEFAYALWGVIRMDMSLPLSYCSLCVTYLIIVVQFSKFID